MLVPRALCRVHRHYRADSERGGVGERRDLRVAPVAGVRHGASAGEDELRVVGNGRRPVQAHGGVKPVVREPDGARERVAGPFDVEVAPVVRVDEERPVAADRPREEERPELAVAVLEHPPACHGSRLLRRERHGAVDAVGVSGGDTHGVLHGDARGSSVRAAYLPLAVLRGQSVRRETGARTHHDRRGGAFAEPGAVVRAERAVSADHKRSRVGDGGVELEHEISSLAVAREEVERVAAHVETSRLRGIERHVA